eukprot:5806774-Lingulodinium_polyedra.AAC.1
MTRYSTERYPLFSALRVQAVPDAPALLGLFLASVVGGSGFLDELSKHLLVYCVQHADGNNALGSSSMISL